MPVIGHPFAIAPASPNNERVTMTERVKTMNIVEGLAGHAHDLAQSVGGKQPVEVWAWVSFTPDQPLDVNCHCVIGKTGSEVARGVAGTIEAAFVKCIEEWKKKGAIVDAKDAELKKLMERAEKIGYTLTPATSKVANNMVAAAIIESKPMAEYQRDE